MASMVFASSPLSAQSLVKRRTNSNYPHSSSYVPSPSSAKNSYVHLSYKNISHIESSKSSFTKGEGNFSFSLPKFPRVASTLSPSLNIIKACSGEVNIYHFKATDRRTGEYIQLSDKYTKKILLITNIPRKDSKWAKSEISFLNNLRGRYGNGFEVLGFLHDKKDLKENSKDGGKKKEDLMGEDEILTEANFPIFETVKVNDDHKWDWDSTKIKQRGDLWYYLRKTRMGDNDEIVEIIKEEFEKFLVDGTGKPVHHWPRFPMKPMEDMNDGGNPGALPSGVRVLDDLTLRGIIQSRIDRYFPGLSELPSP